MWIPPSSGQPPSGTSDNSDASDQPGTNAPPSPRRLHELLAAFDVPLTQDHRLLKLQLSGHSSSRHALIPHRLVGEEMLSRPYRYRLDVIAQRGDIELKSLIAQPATLEIRQADGSYRQLSGLVESAALLGEDGGVFYYQLELVPWLAMLSLGRDSRIFQDKTVVEIIEAVFDGHDVAKGGYRFDLRRDYPARSYCVQYRESDYHFVNRLMEQEGLFYYFEHHPFTNASSDSASGAGEVSHRLVITDDVMTCPAVAPQTIRFHRQAATETEDAITQWGGKRVQQPTRVSLATFDYKHPRRDTSNTQHTIRAQGNLPANEVYDFPGEYYYADHGRGERLGVNRLEALESRAKRFFGAGGARQLQVGGHFTLTQHHQHDRGDASEREFLVLALNLYAENALPVSAHLSTLPGSLQQELTDARRAHGLDHAIDGQSLHQGDYQRAGTGHFLVDFEAQRRLLPYRSTLDHPRPIVGGPQTAIVVGPEGEEIHTDRLNRVKVQFHWDREGAHNAQSSCWLRVASPNASAGWGGVFVPRIGQEVIVDFLEGDPDRPLITGRLYNGDERPEWHSNGLLSGLKSKTYRGGKYNELVFDDATDQERVRLNSEHAKSQLNLGYLIHQQGNTRGDFRGTGFELRTDAYGAVRANEGLLLTSWGQLGAGGEQLDLSPAWRELQAAWQLADTLSDSAVDHQAEPLASLNDLHKASDDAQGRHGRPASTNKDRFDGSSAQSASQGGQGEAGSLKAPWLHLASPAGIAASTPQSTHLVQGKSLSITSGEDINLAAGRSLIGSLSEKLSLFVQRAGIKLFAAQGKVDVQAQSDEMALTAEKKVTITSTEDAVHIAAAEEILLTSGGGYIRLKGGDIEIHAPGLIDVKGGQHLFAGPASLSYPLANLPVTEPTNLELEHLYGNGQPVPGARYRAILADGSIRQGVLDAAGKATLTGVPTGAVQVEYFQDPRDIEKRPQAWPRTPPAKPRVDVPSTGVVASAKGSPRGMFPGQNKGTSMSPPAGFSSPGGPGPSPSSLPSLLASAVTAGLPPLKDVLPDSLRPHERDNFIGKVVDKAGHQLEQRAKKAVLEKAFNKILKEDGVPDDLLDGGLQDTLQDRASRPTDIPLSSPGWPGGARKKT
ncbi:type VI secretion system tip protein VgrG [Halomonas sp. DP8Y7-3]|uniref:type VI secretion system Vgr family protein n=1 Tax=Halomonas sp. DP8Y7-3 TaxID=2859079 RepID=UPI001C97CBCE|nr:type VI secretion system Vgr family protein [Halomonas sp. DP8Y7-3]MBY5927599.1 type VI secretion system tip protein VgrG [Halomonas sp. DP8Y7-3]